MLSTTILHAHNLYIMLSALADRDDYRMRHIYSILKGDLIYMYVSILVKLSRAGWKLHTKLLIKIKCGCDIRILHTKAPFTRSKPVLTNPD